MNQKMNKYIFESIGKAMKEGTAACEKEDLMAVATAVNVLAKELSVFNRFIASQKKMGAQAWLADPLCSVLSGLVEKRVSAEDVHKKLPEQAEKAITLPEFSKLFSKLAQSGALESRGFRIMKVTPSGYQRYDIYKVDPDDL